MAVFDARAVKEALLKYPGRYETQTGETFHGCPVSQVPQALREAGWRNVSRFDGYNLQQLGFRMVVARYVGGARPKRFCLVVFLKEIAPKVESNPA